MLDIVYLIDYSIEVSNHRAANQMTNPKFIFTQWKGAYVSGLCLFGTDGFIKRYVSQAMADRTVAKIQLAGINCKSVPNYKGWAIVAV